MMKNRIRSLKTKETIGIETQILPLSSITLIAGKLSSTPPSSPVFPQSIPLSIDYQREELGSSSPTDSLHSLGVTSGDDLFYSQTPTLNSETEEEDGEIPAETLTLDMEIVSATMEKAPSVARFLERVQDLERDGMRGKLGFVVAAVHSVLLESGFLACNGNGSRLPRGWNSVDTLVSIQYTVPDLLAQVQGRDVKVVVLKFSVMRNHVSCIDLWECNRRT